jgi:hypothetical protein
MGRAAHQTDAVVDEGLESLSQMFLRLKPLLVDSWLAKV